VTESYVVQAGDTLWSIAQIFYGDGAMWPRIAEANQESLVNTVDLIHVGLRLTIPPLNLSSPPGCSAERTVIVEPGDSLWSIAERELGDPEQWPLLVEANHHLIDEPGVIEAGWELIIPCATIANDSYTNETPSEEKPVEVPVEVPVEPEQPQQPQEPPGPGEAPVEADDPGVDEELPSENSDSSGPPTSEEPPAGDTQTGESLAVIESVLGVSAPLAVGVVVMLRRRRQAQLRARPVGRRILYPSDEARQLESTLNFVSSQIPARQAALRLQGLEHLEDFDPGVEPVIEPVEAITEFDAGIMINIGSDEQGKAVLADVSGGKMLVLEASQALDLRAMMCGIALGLATEENPANLDLHIVGSDEIFETVDGVELHESSYEAINSLTATLVDRRSFLGADHWIDLRRDPNFGEAWRPVVYCFLEPVDQLTFDQLCERVGGVDVGMAIVASRLNESPTAEVMAATVRPDRLGQAGLEPLGVRLYPTRLQPSQPLAELLQVSAASRTTRAWWSSTLLGGSSFPTSQLAPAEGLDDPLLKSNSRLANDDKDTAMPAPLSWNDPSPGTTFSHPTLKLLGPIVLEGAQGEAPVRAERACMEYCAWLLEHPGTTAVAMAQGLLVAEGTRRSNMSRLRSWLGQDQANEPYLPEAYSGRIWLNAAVTSDWLRLCMLVGSGVEMADTERLLAGLQLVRGAPLADAAPGQWHWAEEIRTDMVCLIRDMGVVATRRCLELGDIDQARWAASRALVAAPEDELLLCARLETENAAGNRLEVERLANWITRNARNIGIDLLPETVATLQTVISRPPPSSVVH
jgi:LysM repeat protein